MKRERASEPVVVVGAGPVGLSAAIELARRDVPVRIIDAATGPSTTSKAIGTHARTLEALVRSGVTDRLVERGLPIRRFRLHDQARVLGDLDLAELPSVFPYALSLGQDVTERVLLDRLSELGVEVEWGTRLEALHQDLDSAGSAEVRLVLARDGAGDDPSGATGRSEEMAASWVVGCDGARSMVRRQARIGFTGEPFPEWFLVADLLIDGDLGKQRANLFFSDAGGTAVFPLPEPGAFRLATPLPRPEAAEDAPTIDLAAIRHLWNGRVGRPARLSEPRWISPFQFQIRLADQYRRGRVFLAGDAAHVHSPVGGQGMNTGIQDVVNLAWKLAAVRRGAPEALLDTYQTERRPVAAHVLAQTRRNAVMVSSGSATVRAARAVILPLVTRAAPVRRRILNELTMLSVSYPPHLLPGSPPGPSLRERVTGAAAVGERAPDARIVRDGQPGRLVDILAPRAHTLLHFDAGHPDVHLPTDLDLEGRDDITVALVRRRHCSRGTGADLERRLEVHDAEGQAHRTYAVSRPLAVLVRPDGVIGWRGALTSAGSGLRAVLDTQLPAKAG
jgi:NADPH-dependent dioxygenase